MVHPTARDALPDRPATVSARGRALLTVAGLGAVCVLSGAAGSRVPAVDRPGEPEASRAAGRAHLAVSDMDTVSDPERVLEEAKDRQRAFERHRRRRLPYGGGVAPHRCDEIVGRYCLWHEDGSGEERDPPAEPESVRRERARLLDHLGRAVEAVPGSEWLVGQRVRYLLEAGRLDEALEAAGGCRAAGWWCRALRGRVLHAKGRFVEADRTFGDALRAMGERRRRRWTNLSVLLEGDAGDRWDDLGPEGRRRMARRLWRLADPLYLVRGNDRRTEHLARVVAVRTREDGATPFGRFWTDGLGELTLRYGLPAEYRREPPSPSRLDPEPAVIARHPPHALSFLPAPEAVLRPGRADEDDWRPDAERPHASYAAPYADTVRRLPHRIAVFPRGDTSVVVASYRSGWGEGDAGPEGAGREALLRLVPTTALDTPYLRLPASDDRRTGADRGGLAVRVPSRPHLVAVELLHREAEVAERARYALRLPRRPEGVPGLSDLLLLEPGAPVEGSLEDVLPGVRGPGPLRPGARLGLYWELYGPRLLLDDVEVSVALAEEEGGLIERLAGVVGLAGEEAVALEWPDAAGRPGRVHPRGLRLRLPDRLSEGEYLLEVSVRVPGYDPMTVRRRLEVRKGPGE